MSDIGLSKASKGPWVAESNSNRAGYYIYSEGDDCVVVNMDRTNDASLKYQAREEADAHMLGASRALYDAAVLAAKDATKRVDGKMVISADAYKALLAAISQAEGEKR